MKKTSEPEWKSSLLGNGMNDSPYRLAAGFLQHPITKQLLRPLDICR